jgi:hypothetical protein
LHKHSGETEIAAQAGGAFTTTVGRKPEKIHHDAVSKDFALSGVEAGVLSGGAFAVWRYAGIADLGGRPGATGAPTIRKD